MVLDEGDRIRAKSTGKELKVLEVCNDTILVKRMSDGKERRFMTVNLMKYIDDKSYGFVVIKQEHFNKDLFKL